MDIMIRITLIQVNILRDCQIKRKCFIMQGIDFNCKFKFPLNVAILMVNGLTNVYFKN